MGHLLIIHSRWSQYWSIVHHVPQWINGLLYLWLYLQLLVRSSSHAWFFVLIFHGFSTWGLLREGCFSVNYTIVRLIIGFSWKLLDFIVIWWETCSRERYWWPRNVASIAFSIATSIIACTRSHLESTRIRIEKLLLWFWKLLLRTVWSFWVR